MKYSRTSVLPVAEKSEGGAARRPSSPPPLEERICGIPGRRRNCPVRSQLPPSISDPEKICEMRTYLQTLGCLRGKGYHNQLVNNKPFLIIAINKYKEIFGCLPTQAALISQHLTSLIRPINTCYRGFSEMQAAFGEVREPGKPRGRGAAKRRPAIPKWEPPFYGGIEPKLKNEQEADPQRMSTRSGKRIIFLDYCGRPDREIEMARKFILANPERIVRKERGPWSETLLSLTQRGPLIPVDADQKERKFLFMEKDIPALVFVAIMESGSKEEAEREIAELSRSFWAPGRIVLESVKTKLIAGRGFYVANRNGEGALAKFDPERFSPQSVEALHAMFANPEKYMVRMHML